MVLLIPHIKSAYQIRSFVKMTINRRTKTLTSRSLKLYFRKHTTTMSLHFIHRHLHCSGSDEALMFPKIILNVDLSYLPSVQNYFIDFRK